MRETRTGAGWRERSQHAERQSGSSAGHSGPRPRAQRPLPPSSSTVAASCRAPSLPPSSLPSPSRCCALPPLPPLWVRLSQRRAPAAPTPSTTLSASHNESLAVAVCWCVLLPVGRRLSADAGRARTATVTFQSGAAQSSAAAAAAEATSDRGHTLRAHRQHTQHTRTPQNSKADNLQPQTIADIGGGGGGGSQPAAAAIMSAHPHCPAHAVVAGVAGSGAAADPARANLLGLTTTVRSVDGRHCLLRCLCRLSSSGQR